MSPEVARLSLSPDTGLSPSPPLSATAAAGNHKPPGIRARRLRQTSSQHLPDLSGVGCLRRTTAEDTVLTSQRAQKVTRADLPVLPLRAHLPRPPPTTPQGKGLMDPWYGVILDYFLCQYVCVYTVKKGWRGTLIVHNVLCLAVQRWTVQDRKHGLAASIF